ncbi:Rv3235 family protein [Actinomyces bowdenii]|uniref:Rv3235 family protein n=1 Tax=Actinomyces bowdenii TaxID=131109 RepID=UPI00214B2A76|nr:Rv3235 family protein [Actinomyces bowdenii]MCR2052373.1 Rv3235 family protein [Actinomyces bowdenii]
MTTTTMTPTAGQRTSCSAAASAGPVRPPAAAGAGRPARRTRPQPSGPAPSRPGPATTGTPAVEESVKEPVKDTIRGYTAGGAGAGDPEVAGKEALAPESRISLAPSMGALEADAGQVIEPELLIGTGGAGPRRRRGALDLSEDAQAAGRRAAPATSTGAPDRSAGREPAVARGREGGAQERSTPPHPARSAAVIVVAAAEVLAGQRPVDHLTRWTTPAMFEAIARRAGLATRVLGARRRSHRPRMRSVHTQLTVSGACEATILLEDSGRVRAAAARLIAQRGRWILAGLEIA